MNVSNDAYGRASAVIAAAVGIPSSESSQCTTTSRPPASAASLPSSGPKITECSSRLA
jgi:hypothetical protein